MKQITAIFLKSICVVSVLLILNSCSYSSSTRGGQVGADREQFFMVSAAQMQQGAVTAYKEVLTKSRSDGTLNRDPAQTRRVRAIAKRLIPHTNIFRDDAPGWNWEVNVIDSPELNAWCMPGGKIAFYTGIINKLQLTDDEIAAIMGHEMAHALREHGRERVSESQLTNLGLGLLGELAGLSASDLKLANTVTAVTIGLPNSREHETEADRMGVELSARAGYDPAAAVTVWEKMSAYSEGAPPEILSTHPSNKTRIKDLKKYSARVQPLYKQALSAQ